jgi:phosphohistidine phosphatase
MALYIVQHGKSLSKEADPEQGLSDEGIAGVMRIAEVAEGYRVRVGSIRHSPKVRAVQTAEILQQALHPLGVMEVMEGLKPLDDVTCVASEIINKDDVMLVGHLPFMERLVSYLITGATEKIVFKFQNGGIVCLDQGPDSHEWFIKWSLMPNIG